MNTKRIIQFFIFISVPFLSSYSQTLVFPKNNLEYMCITLSSLSNFDNNTTNFVAGAGSFLVDGQAHLSITTAFATGGINKTKCLRVQPSTSPFPTWGGTFYLQYNQTPVSIGTTEGVGVWMKATKDTYVNFYFQDATGIIFYVPRKLLDGNADWEYTYAKPDSYRKQNNSSSTVNPVISYPCKFLGFGLQTLEEGTTIYVDEVSKIQEHNRTLKATFQTTPQKLANVYSLGESVSATVTSSSNKLKLIIKDYKGVVVDEKTGDKTINLQLPTSTLGYFEILVLSYTDTYEPSKLTSAEMFRYGVTNNEIVYNDRLGVCTHIQRDYYSIKCVDLMSVIGARNMRMELVMDYLDNGNGTFSLKYGDDIMTAAKAKGCKFKCILISKTPHLTDPMIAKFLDYSRFVLNKFRNTIDKVEIWNEWSHHTGTLPQYIYQQTPENYAKFISSIYPTLKKEFPEVEVIGIGGEVPQMYRNEILQMFQANVGKSMDAFSLHPYRQPEAPDSRVARVGNKTIDEQVLDIVDIAKANNANPKVYVTEIGHPGNLTSGGKGDLTQAHYLVKMLSLLFTTKVIEHIDWYNLYDMDEIGINSKYTKPEEYEQFHFGLFEGKAENFAAKPAALAYRFFAKVTSGFDTSTKYDDGNGFFKVTFKDKLTGELDVVWNKNTTALFPIPSGATVYDIMGNTIQNQGFIMLGREPVYIVKSPLSSVINTLENKKALTIFPNPTDGIFNIKIPESCQERNSAIELHNVNGILLERIETNSPEVNLNISNRPSGLYFVSLLNDNNILKGKVILN
jgi:hypothetical protein